MPRIGMSELLLILAIALIVFGPSRLPSLGRMVGKTVGQIKNYANTITEDLENTKQETPATTDASVQESAADVPAKKDPGSAEM
ncbi:Sec-independent protein translocase protein TatB [Paenibacillus puldeungensis]|uniref:Sec-independent protein translocase protein TatB n=1 Tax=Paenibacillus puldeungensis TaxID=696536 RepID=A0ABW3S0V4_9BACL